MSIPASRLKEALPWVSLLSLMFFINYTDRSIFGPLLVYMEQDLSLNHAQAVGFMSYLAAGFSVAMALSGFIVSQIKPRFVISISLGLCGLSVLSISQISHISLMQLCFVLLGGSAGLYFTSAMATMGSLIEPQLWSKSIAIHEFAPPFSFILAPLLAEYGIALTGDWRGALHILGISSITVAILFLAIGRGGNQLAQCPSWSGLKESARSPLLWFFAWCFAFGVAGEFAPYNVLSLHLTAERGLTPEHANQLLSLSRLASPFAVLIGGLVCPKLGAKRSLQLFFSVHGLALLLMSVTHFPLALCGLFIQPLMPAFAFPVIFTLITRNFPLEKHPMLLGLSVPLASYIGTGVAPKLLGLSGLHFSFSAGFAAMGAICLLTLPFCRIVPGGKDTVKLG